MNMDKVETIMRINRSIGRMFDYGNVTISWDR